MIQGRGRLFGAAVTERKFRTSGARPVTPVGMADFQVMSSRVVTAFRVVAFAEAVSWLGLLIGMYLKRVAETTEVGVQVFGPIHGAVFVTYVLLTLYLARVQRWSIGTTVLGLAASIPPFFTVVFEIWAKRTGRLESPQESSAPVAA
ncbi:DUF3817 domain-containing protein [Kineosporia mesophila]|uniref:DUF3817 domain-containing protein n=1 Tax=Kineosporia mesophila TaxID=566012 RepID=UPI001E3D6B10|nr:DUF3817 domain-containing protein [Kineosporia mesophila]